MLKFYINSTCVILSVYWICVNKIMQSEFGFLKNLRNRFNLSIIGDDCAVLPKDAESDLLVTTDMLVEDIDFRMKWADPAMLGGKALVVSLSDIAAMGGTPSHSLLSIGVPEKLWKTGLVDKIFQGFWKKASVFHTEIVGGDVSKTPDKLILNSIVLGKVSKGNAVLRSTAKPGDSIFVTGRLGGAAAGLRLLEAGVPSEKSWQEKLIRKQLSPFPHKGDSLIDVATSMIDISDGLSSDLSHICEESSVGARIYAERIPVEKKIGQLVASRDERLELALNGGEDFELLFTVNPKSFSHKSLAGCFHIGEITETPQNIELIRGGESEILKPKGYSHF